MMKRNVLTIILSWFTKRCLVHLLIFVLLLGNTWPPLVIAQSDDRVAPEISNLQISDIGDNAVTITWETDEEADSAINYGLKPDYGIARVPVADRTEHSVTIDQLEPGRTYYFRVLSTDAAGNQGISADYRTQTTGESANVAGHAKAPDAAELVRELRQIKNPDILEEIISEALKAAQGITSALTIVGPPTVIPETSTALVRWTTDRPSNSEVLFSETEGFDGDNFAFSQASTDGDTTEHEVRLIGLDPFTEYSFRVQSTDQSSITGSSRVFTFQTKATAPEIRNLRVVKVEENAATLAWDTNVPTKALVEYQDQSTGGQNSVGRPTLATTHQMRLADLTLGTRYVAFVTAENSGGDRVRSQPIQFITVRDIVPPVISNVTNDSTLFPGSESRIQTIVEWNTDEPSSCTMTYQEGAVGGDEFVIEPEQIEHNTAHVEVIVDFSPATVYTFWLNCSDVAGNSIESEKFVLFTPIQEKNIIDLILENFESTFGWVNNVGG